LIAGLAVAHVVDAAVGQDSLAAEGTPAEWEVGAGAINSFETATFAMVYARYHLGWDCYGIRLWAEGTVIDGGAFWVGGGLRYDIRLGDDWRIGLASGPGYFRESDELDLGHEIEFFSSIELVRTLGKRTSLVAGIGHLSNAGFGDYNPGANTYRLSFRWRE
jgi:hypothetical protein